MEILGWEDLGSEVRLSLISEPIEFSFQNGDLKLVEIDEELCVLFDCIYTIVLCKIFDSAILSFLYLFLQNNVFLNILYPIYLYQRIPKGKLL